MADISVTAASVQAADSNTVTATKTAGAAITAGEAVYVSAAGTLLLVENDQTATEGAVVGIALNDAASGQPCTYALSGNVTFNAVLTAGVTYYTSSTAGGIAPEADNGTGDFNALIGFATSTTNMTLVIKPFGVAHG